MLKNLKKHSVPLLILLATTIGISFSMLFAPYSKETFGHDAGIFAYIGYAITQGEPLYTGAWDNKGPLLYLIDALGIIINYRYGIFILEFLSLFITLIFFYKTALKFVSRYIAVIVVMLTTMPLTASLQGGNLSEEWALPFTAVAFYLIVKFYQNNYVIKNFELLIFGACVSAIVLLRLNIIMFIAVATLGVIITLINEKQIKKLFRICLMAFLGFILFTLPFAIYLIATDSFKACINTAYLGVVGTFSPIPPIAYFTNISSMIFKFKDSGAFFIILLFIAIYPFYIFKHKSPDKTTNTLLTINFWGLIATLLGNSISGADQMHYFMAFIPALILPIAWFSKGIFSFLNRNNATKFGATAIIAAIALIISLNSISTLRDNIINNLQDGTNAHLQTQGMRISDYIRTNTTPKDRVQVIGDAAAVTSYYRAQRLAASNYFYYANGRFSDNAKTHFADEIFKDMKETLPKLIIFTEEWKKQDFLAHLSDSEDYRQFIQSNYTTVENDFSVTTYILK